MWCLFLNCKGANWVAISAIYVAPLNVIVNWFFISGTSNVLVSTFCPFFSSKLKYIFLGASSQDCTRQPFLDMLLFLTFLDAFLKKRVTPPPNVEKLVIYGSRYLKIQLIVVTKLYVIRTWKAIKSDKQKVYHHVLTITIQQYRKLFRVCCNRVALSDTKNKVWPT